MIRLTQHELAHRPGRVLSAKCVPNASRSIAVPRRSYARISYHPGQLGLERRNAAATGWVRTYAASSSPPPASQTNSASNTSEPPVIPRSSASKAASSSASASASASASRSRKVDLTNPAPVKSTSASHSNPSAASSSLHSPSATPSPSPSVSSTTPSSATPSSSTPPITSTSNEPSSTSDSNPLSSLISPDSESGRILASAQADLRASVSAGILAPPPANASKFGKLLHTAKELFKFYFNGVKMQWTHHKLVRSIEARVEEEKKAGKEVGMSRWETQFVRTHQKDLKKLVPFVLILIIIEEILPLIVIYAPFMLPSTTILPSQAERIYQTREKKMVETLTTAKWYAESEGLLNAKDALGRLDVKALSNDLAWTVCRAFGLSDRGPRALVNRRLSKHLEYIAQDDFLLARETPSILLTLAELRGALSERGQLTEGSSHDELQTRLEKWLEKVQGKKEGILPAFLQYAVSADLTKKPATVESESKSS